MHEITGELKDGLVTLQDATVALGGARVRLTNFEVTELAAAKQGMDNIESADTMAAYASGAIDGKNIAQRNLQLNAFLSELPEYQAAVKRLGAALANQSINQAQLENAEDVYKTACYAARSRIAMAGLEAAMAGRHAQEENEGSPF